MKKIIALLLVMVLLCSLVPAFAAETEIAPYAYYATEKVPQIYIDTENGLALNDPSLINPNKKGGIGGTLNTYNYIDAAVSVRNCEGYEFEDIPAQVKVRGNYTSTYPKYPIRIKFDSKMPMCGLNDGHKMKSWVLLAEYKEASHLRNSAVFYLANSLYSTTGNYCSDFRNVEVYINGEYFGLYVLAEQQQVNKYRVNIPQPADPADYDTTVMTEEELAALKDVHTGYFFEYDGYYTNEDPAETFTIRYDRVTKLSGQTFLPTSPDNVAEGTDSASGEASGWFGGFSRGIGYTIKSDIYTEEQNAFLKKVVQTIWDVLYDAVYGNHTDLAVNPYHTMDADGNYIEAPAIASAYEACASVVDIDSLIDMYIIQEIAQDSDLDWSSFFFCIDMSPEGNHHLVYTAPWDFDSGFRSSTDSLFAMENTNPWFTLFCGQDWFWQFVNERWDAAMEAGVFTGLIEMLDTLTELNADAYDRNTERWSQSGVTSTSMEAVLSMLDSASAEAIREMLGSGEPDTGEAEGQTVSEHVRAEQSLRDWIETRIETLDRLIDEMAAE